MQGSERRAKFSVPLPSSFPQTLFAGQTRHWLCSPGVRIQVLKPADDLKDRATTTDYTQFGPRTLCANTTRVQRRRTGAHLMGAMLSGE